MSHVTICPGRTASPHGSLSRPPPPPAVQDAWKTKSPALAREDEVERLGAVEKAAVDRARFASFVRLADALVLAQMSELARAGLAVALHQLFLPRSNGLFSLAACSETDDDDGSSAAPLGAGTGAVCQRGFLVITPAEADIRSALREDLHDTVGVASQAAMGLMHYGEVRGVMRQLFGNTAVAGGGHVGGAGPGDWVASAAGRPTAIQESLSRLLGLIELQEEVEARVKEQYQAMMEHQVRRVGGCEGTEGGRKGVGGRGAGEGVVAGDNCMTDEDLCEWIVGVGGKGKAGEEVASKGSGTARTGRTQRSTTDGRRMMQHAPGIRQASSDKKKTRQHAP